MKAPHRSRDQVDVNYHRPTQQAMRMASINEEGCELGHAQWVCVDVCREAKLENSKGKGGNRENMSD